jgi:hypothetical protein
MTEPKYLARAIESVERGPGIWNGLRVGVYRVQDGREERIGEYSRNYGTNFDCFFPFRRNGADYALFSPDYTCTRVMELPSCKDLGGEEPESGGFCPVEYYVPSFVRHEFRSPSLAAPFVQTIWEPKDADLLERTVDGCAYRPLGPLTYVPFGFVAGCYWGDDSSWKVQYLDLSRAHQGVVKRDERFGYIVLPTRLGLADAIVMRGAETEDPLISIAVEKGFRLSGTPLDEEA